MTRVLVVDRSIRWGMLPGPVKRVGSSPLDTTIRFAGIDKTQTWQIQLGEIDELIDDRHTVPFFSSVRKLFKREEIPRSKRRINSSSIQRQLGSAEWQ